MGQKHFLRLVCWAHGLTALAAGVIAEQLDRVDGGQLRAAVQDLALTPHLLRFAVDGCRFTVFPDGRALLFGVHDPLRARALCAVSSADLTGNLIPVQLDVMSCSL